MCVPLCWSCGTVDSAPSLMYMSVCNLPHFRQTHLHRNEVRWCHERLCCVSSSTSCCACVTTRACSYPCVSLQFWLSLVTGISVSALRRLLTGYGWLPQCVVWLADWGSCLHCICAPSEEEQTPCRLQPVHQSVITHKGTHAPLFPTLWHEALLLCRPLPLWQVLFLGRRMVFLTSWQM